MADSRNQDDKTSTQGDAQESKETSSASQSNSNQGSKDSGKQALGTTQAAISAAQAGAQTAQAAQAGDVGGAATGATGAASSVAGAAGDSRLASTIQTAGTVASVAQASSGLAQAALDALGGEEIQRVRFSFRSSGDSETVWRVRHLALHESLNEPFQMDLELISENMDSDPALLLGNDAEVDIEREPLLRTVKGIVDRVERGNCTDAFITAKVRIIPALWLLRHRVNSRIYQDLSVPEILEELLGESLASYQRTVNLENLEREYPKREYTVQYDESDFAFASRLMEEEGIGYFFGYEGETEELLLVDSNNPFESITTLDDGPVQFVLSGAELGDIEPVQFFARTECLGVTSRVVRDYDWTQPERFVENELRAEDTLGRDRETFEHRNALNIGAYDPGPRKYQEEDAEAQVNLRQEASAMPLILGQGHGFVTGFQPGQRFELSNHPDVDLNGEYILISVHHEGAPPDPIGGNSSKEPSEHRERYVNHFRCIPADCPYRPARKHSKPRVQGVETATVVGPSGEEIYTDEHARICVQFHWDRLGENNERSSCFMRVSQPWSGSGWGFVFLPRIGMEVIVTFEHGNPDRPIVTGCLYNGSHLTPHPQPDSKTKSTIRTQSSPGGEGFNEISFEDAKDAEEIFVHAQKDYNETVENNHSTTVKSNQTNSVSGNQTESVGKDQSLTVDGNRTMVIKGHHSITVEGDGSSQGDTQGGAMNITGDYKLDASSKIDVQAPSKITLTCGGSSVTIEPGKITLAAGGEAQLVLDANALMQSSAGSKVLLDGNALTESSGGSTDLLDGNVTTTSSGGSQIELTGNAVMSSSGGSQVELNATATVSGASEATLTAPTAKVTGQAEASLSAGGSVKAEPSGVTADGGTVNINGSGTVNVKGGVVALN